MPAPGAFRFKPGRRIETSVNQRFSEFGWRPRGIPPVVPLVDCLVHLTAPRPHRNPWPGPCIETHRNQLFRADRKNYGAILIRPGEREYHLLPNDPSDGPPLEVRS